MIGPLPYIGGKRAIANQIIAAFRATENQPTSPLGMNP